MYKKKPQLQNPTDIYDIIRPLYVISKVLGLAPFKLKNKWLSPEYGPIVPLRILIIVGGMCFIATNLEDDEEVSDIAELALRCELYLGTFMTFSVLTLAAINQKYLINIVMKLADIDEKMRSVHIELSYRNCKKFLLIQIVLITCSFALKVALQYFSYTTSTLVMYSAFNFVDYINTIMLFQYINLVLLIRQRFVWINKRLEDVCKYSHPINLNKHKRPLVPVLSIKIAKLSAISRFDVLLESLANIYITVGSRFVMITTQLINTYHTIRDPDQGNVTQYLVLSIYLILHMSKIFMVASVCESTSFKAKETGIYLHHIWELIPAYKDEIKYFSMQILHQNLTFTGCGFFALDNTLMYSIVGAVATYFVIFIQLEKTF